MSQTPTFPENFHKELYENHAQYFKPALAKYFETEVFPPVNLVCGPSGIGKRTTILKTIDLINCDRPYSMQACGECSSCQRAQVNQRLDLHWLDTSEGQHKIEPFRELKSKQGFGPSHEPFRSVVICDIDRITIQAANSILKLLEEPPKGWLFFLTSENDAQVLPTIRSRCQVLNLKPIPYSILSTVLENQGIESERAKILSSLAQGSLSNALTLNTDDIVELRTLCSIYLMRPDEAKPRLFEIISASPENYKLSLMIFESLLVDLMRGQQADWINHDLKPELEYLFVNQNQLVDQLADRIFALQELRFDNRLPINAKLQALETLNMINLK